MATENAVFENSAPFTVSSGACTITSGDLAITVGNLSLVAVSSTTGRIMLNGNRFFHITNQTFRAGICVGTNSCGNSFISGQMTTIGYSANSGGRYGKQLAIGANAQQQDNNGIYSTSIGYFANKNSTNINYNVGLGANAGISFGNGNSDNCIALLNAGVSAKTNAMYIGTQGSGDGQQQDCYIAGVYAPANALGATQKVVMIDSSLAVGQIGGLAGGVGTILIGGNKPIFSAAGSTGDTLIATTSADVSWSGSPSWTGTITASSGNVAITTGLLALPTTTATVGQITLNSNPLLHAYGTNNTFLNSGNLTLTTTNATNNTGIGQSSLAALAGSGSGLGKENTAFSSGALSSCTDGSYNSSHGYQSLNLLTTGTNCTSIGYQSLGQCLTSVGCTSLGNQAGNNYSGSESSNICIGSGVTGTASESNVLRIGAGTGTSANQLNAAYIYGINGITVTSVDPVLVSTSDQLGITTSSERFKENIKDIDDISEKLMKLRPVSFNYKKNDNKIHQYGLIAEEVSEILPELVNYDKEGLPFSIYYEKLPAILLKEIQKLNNRLDFIELRRDK